MFIYDSLGFEFISHNIVSLVGNGTLEDTKIPHVITPFEYKNVMLNFKLCVCPAFLFSVKIPGFMVNPDKYTTKSHYYYTNGLVLKPKSSSGYILVSTVPSRPSVVGCGGVLLQQSVLRETSGRGGFQ